MFHFFILVEEPKPELEMQQMKIVYTVSNVHQILSTEWKNYEMKNDVHCVFQFPLDSRTRIANIEMT